jgi:hypothetical protein
MLNIFYKINDYHIALLKEWIDKKICYIALSPNTLLLPDFSLYRTNKIYITVFDFYRAGAMILNTSYAFTGRGKSKKPNGINSGLNISFLEHSNPHISDYNSYRFELPYLGPQIAYSNFIISKIEIFQDYYLLDNNFNKTPIKNKNNNDLSINIDSILVIYGKNGECLLLKSNENFIDIVTDLESIKDIIYDNPFLKERISIV